MKMVGRVGRLKSPATMKFTFNTEAAVDCPDTNENSFLLWLHAN